MKNFLALSLIVGTVSVANAECFMRSSTLNEIKGRIERSADINRVVVPLNNNQQKCTVTFRIMVDGVWHTAQGDAIGSLNIGDNQLCAQAQDVGRARLLQSIDGSRSSVTQEMVCTDQNIPKWKPVKTGDIIRESEVAPHWDLNKRQSFVHRGMECRWFIETMPYSVGGMVQSQGIMCRMANERWLVSDKWIASVDR